MKKIFIIFIVIGMLGGIYIYARVAEDNHEKGAYFGSTVFISSTFETFISTCKEDFVTKAANISQDEPNIDKLIEEAVVPKSEPYIEEPVVELSDEELEQIKREADSFLSASVVSDFLTMDSEDFENKYDRNQLYERNILYCDMAAWRYQGTQLDGFQDPEDYYDVINIAALRYTVDDRLYDFIEEYHSDAGSIGNSSSMTDVYIQHVGDYAISIYFQRDMDTQKEDSMKLLEISYVKVELGEGEAPRSLYQYLENDYYEVREAILSEDWIISPDRNKEICVMNGALPKHPAQIFIRYRDKRPDTVFRFTWEQGISGWIDEEHVICYMMDWKPKLIHLETNQVEEIDIAVGENGRRVFDSYGAHYEINENKLIARVLGEEVYRWDIVKENNEVFIMEEN